MISVLDKYLAIAVTCKRTIRVMLENIECYYYIYFHFYNKHTTFVIKNCMNLFLRRTTELFCFIFKEFLKMWSSQWESFVIH